MIRVQPQKTVFFTLFVASLMGGSKAVALDLAQTPLFLTSSVEPNVVFMFDDSGSMQFETLPQSLTNHFQDLDGGAGPHDGIAYMYPIPSDTYGSSIYDSRPIPRFDDDDKWSAYFRSPENNKMYYNPEINYKPWVKQDGSRMDDADPEAAPYHPQNGNSDTLDLTAEQTDVEDEWLVPNISETADDQDVYTKYSYYPATYFEYDGSGDKFDDSSYDRIQIKNTAGVTYDGGPERTDCKPSPSTCTYNQEIQNFANWFTYHRSRTLTARAGVGAAFAERGGGIRVGYGQINEDGAKVDGGTRNTSVTKGVRKFDTETNRNRFFNALYGGDVSNSGTPLRQALEDVGEYYSRTDGATVDDKGPWSSTPGASGGEDYECRSSYTVLMTDGFWNGSDADVGNSDNSSGNEITNPAPDGTNFTYSPVDPFKDSFSETLADVSMEYWKTDLQSPMSNEVPPTGIDKAFWQHMVTYGVSFGVEGSVDPISAFDAIPDKLGDSGSSISWPDPTDGEDADKIDDLLHASVNSRGGFFSAKKPEAFAKAMGDILNSLIGRTSGSGASVAANSTRLETDTLVFQGRYDSADWSGNLVAYKLDSDGNLATRSWEGATELDNRDLVGNPRTIVTSTGTNPGSGAQFQWASLSASQQIALNDGDGKGMGRVDYLRGYQNDEEQNNGSFRNRNSIMGDVINSRPVYTKDERYGYRSWVTTAGDKYIDFIRGMRDTADPQVPVVYVGGNDGMLHGFHAQTGEELFAYVPAGVYEDLADLTDTQYSHNYYVDGSASVGDVYMDKDGDGTKEWRRVLIGTLGGGGSTVFALDITDPENFGPNDVLWEFEHPQLGPGVKEVSLVRVLVENQNNSDPVYRWDVIFGDGYGGTGTSADNNSQLFIVDAATGNLRNNIEVASGNPNGMASPFVVDDGQDRTADHVYAGDLRGNVWKFSLDNSANWVLDYKLFTATNDSGTRQPITSKLDLGYDNDRNLVVTFGTGKYLEVGDQNTAIPPQDLYGLIDRGSTIDRSNLVEQTLESQTTESGTEYRVVSDNAFDKSVHDGWRVSLDPADGAAKQGERSVVQPLVQGGVVTFVTIVPSANPCDEGGESWLTSVNINSGQRLSSSFFDVNNDGEIDEKDRIDDPLNNDGKLAPTSLKTDSGIIDTPTLLSAEDTDTLILSGSQGEESVKTASDETKGPQSWRQVR